METLQSVLAVKSDRTPDSDLAVEFPQSTCITAEKLRVR
jgi:hypothetical protein